MTIWKTNEAIYMQPQVTCNYKDRKIEDHSSLFHSGAIAEAVHPELKT